VPKTAEGQSAIDADELEPLSVHLTRFESTIALLLQLATEGSLPPALDKEAEALLEQQEREGSDLLGSTRSEHSRQGFPLRTPLAGITCTCGCLDDYVGLAASSPPWR